jgi:hypothetical protein
MGHACFDCVVELAWVKDVAALIENADECVSDGLADVFWKLSDHLSNDQVMALLKLGRLPHSIALDPSAPALFAEHLPVMRSVDGVEVIPPVEKPTPPLGH